VQNLQKQYFLQNIISGNHLTPNVFNANEAINFAEASKIIVNVLLETPSKLENSKHWSDKYLLELSKNNIAVENFEISKKITRREMADLIYALRSFVK